MPSSVSGQDEPNLVLTTRVGYPSGQDFTFLPRNENLSCFGVLSHIMNRLLTKLVRSRLVRSGLCVSGVAERLILRTIICYLWAGYIRIQVTSGIWLTNPLCTLQKPLLSCLDRVWSLGRQNNWSAWEHQKVEIEAIAHRPLRRSLPSPNLVPLP